MSTSVEKIKERLNIVDLLGTYLKLDKAGKNMKACCPFHHEKTPSFFVSAERDSYYCFGCGAKGDIFTFVQEFEGLDFFGALKLLAERTGVTLDRGNFEQKNDKEAIFNCLEAATQFFEANLQAQAGVPKGALKYLEERGLTEKTIKDWRIGFVADDWRMLYEYLTNRKFSDTQIEQAGLIKKSEKGSGFYDRFRGRIMFPIRDSASRVVGFTGRILPAYDTHSTSSGQAVEVAKYLNSPETAVFNKSKILFGFDLAKLAIRKFDYSVIVEGQMDIIMCHQAGFQNVVATSGTALTPEHLTLLRRISNKVIMAFDADKAGLNAATKAWQLALSLGMEVKIAGITDGKDPADLILSPGGLPGQGKEKFKEALKNSMHIVDFYLAKILAEKLDERKMGQAVREQILPFIALVESNIEKAHWVKKISEQARIDEKAIWDDLKKVKVEAGADGQSATFSQGTTKGVSPERADSIARRILGVINWQVKEEEPIIDINKSKEKVREIIGEENFKKWEATSAEIISEATFEAEQYYDKRKLQMVLDELLMELEKEYITKELSQIKTPEEQNLLIKKLAKLK